MVQATVVDLVVGLYLGLLAAIFPALIAFAMGFTFKYFTGVTVPGLGVVVLGGTLAGISGGLMGLLSEEIAGNWSGITAVLVILMGCLWAHAQGDKLAVTTPRKFTLKALRNNSLSADVSERIDSFGQIRIRPIGDVTTIDGYPPLPEALRSEIKDGSWKLPADLSIADLEARLTERLMNEFELAEVSVTVDRRGHAQIAAAPKAGGLSRRVPAGKRAVSINTLLPTGIARGDQVTLRLPKGPVSGVVKSAKTSGETKAANPEAKTTDGDGVGGDGDDEDASQPIMAPTTTGGDGQITVACSLEEAKRVIDSEFAPVSVHSRGKQPEYEAISVLRRHGNRFGKVTIKAGCRFDGVTLGSAQIRDTYGVAVLSIRRSGEQLTVPRGSAELRGGDEVILVGQRTAIRSFEEAMAQ